jgi:protein MpaA
MEAAPAHPDLPAASPLPLSAAAKPDEHAKLDALCSEVRASIAEFKWKLADPCLGIDWKIGGWSVEGRPLIYVEFGDAQASNTSLILSMVHGDEITPLFIGLQLVQWMREHGKSVPDTRVVIAPLVNPDGFFLKPRRRMNDRGVDVNRNFPTSDWPKRALAAWKTRYRSDPRRFPGNAPGSEPETRFQQQLLETIRPQKILSIHSPLNHLDYDGPNSVTLARFPKEYVTEAQKLRRQLRAISSGFFPGSLGNYAGQEKGIPTLTLELPTADSAKAPAYWEKFRTGIYTMIEFKMPEYSLNIVK